MTRGSFSQRSARRWPRATRVAYPLCRYLLDVDELGRLDREVPLFGYNRFAPVSIYDRDYLDRRPGTIRDKVERLLLEKGITGPADRILLVTDAALFRAVFNPVSFYYVFASTGALTAILAEVNNVVGDRHLYLVPGGTGSAEPAFLATCRMDKAFHVSPFNAVEGFYQMRFSDLRERLDIHIDLHSERGPVMTASITEHERVPLSRQSLSRALRHPLLAPWRTLPGS
jgi:DUF1365 family protein